jgi:hypothetical protein
MRVEVIALTPPTRILHGRDISRVVATVIRALHATPKDGCLVLDLADVEIATYRFVAGVADHLIRGRPRHAGKSLMVINVNPECASAIDAAMRLNRDAVLVRRREGGFEILGHYPKFLRDTFSLVQERGPISATQMARVLNLKLTAASERLRRLSEWGFVIRTPRVSRRGPIYVYELPSAPALT